MKKLLERFELLICAVALSVMVLVVCVAVVFRYTGHPLLWSDEVARWMLVYISFAGASYSFKHDGLIQVDYFVKKLFKPRMQKWINAGGIALLGVLFGILGYSGVQYMLALTRRAQKYPITKAPKAVIVAAVVIGSVLILVFSILKVISILRPACLECGGEVSEQEGGGAQ